MSAIIRVLDIFFSLLGLGVLSPVFAVLFIIGLFDTGSPIFRQERIGFKGKAFTLVKFRTMAPDTASVATHLAEPDAITPYGRFLRRTKLDELPQLWNVVVGDMSLVGPRPSLFNQKELIMEREKLNVYESRPGITGRSQIYDIDMSTPKHLAQSDAKMINEMNVKNYLKYIFLTFLGNGLGDRIRQDNSSP